MTPWTQSITALTVLIAGCQAQSNSDVGSAGRSRDELVMNTVLLHFLSDHAKDAWTLGRSKGPVLLHPRNPEKTGILDQTELDIRKRKLDPDLLEALRSRNRGSGWNSKPFSFQKFRLDPRIQIKDVQVGDAWDVERYKRFDKYKGYFEAFAPGYSEDGKHAVVRAWVGPSAHGGTVTYLLELRDKTWTVLWREYAFYV